MKRDIQISFWKPASNANSIHAFNRFEEGDYVERFRFHFRLVDLGPDAFYTLGTATIYGEGTFSAKKFCSPIMGYKKV